MVFFILYICTGAVWGLVSIHIKMIFLKEKFDQDVAKKRELISMAGSHLLELSVIFLCLLLTILMWPATMMNALFGVDMFKISEDKK